MMKRKRWFAVGLFVIIACTGTATVAALRNNVTQENYERIEEGMTKAEVEKIFGSKGKLGEYQYFSSPNLVRMIWKGHDGTACVVFENDMVAKSERIPIKGWSSHSDESISTKIRRWLRI